MFERVQIDKGVVITIDAFDTPRVTSHKWLLSDYRNIQEKTANHLSLPHFIMNVDISQEVEFVDGNVLDFRKANLRFHTKESYVNMLHTKRICRPWSLDEDSNTVEIIYYKYHLNCEELVSQFSNPDQQEAYRLLAENMRNESYEVHKEQYDFLMGPLNAGSDFR